MSRPRVGLPPALVLFACLFAAQSAILVLSPILPLVADDLGVSTAAAAQLRSVSGVTAGVVSLALAVVGGRLRLTRLLDGGLALLAAGSAVSALAPGFGVLLGAQVVLGLGLALVLSGGLAASEEWATDGESGKVLSWALIGQPVAWVVGQPITGAVAAQGWRWAWVAVPLLASVAGLVAVSVRDRSIPDSGRDCDPFGLARLPGVRSWAVAELLGFAAWAGVLVYIGAFFIETYAAGVDLTGLILGLGALAYLPGNFLGRRLIHTGAARLVLTASLGAAVVAAVVMSVRAGLVFSAVAFGALAFVAAGRTIGGAALGLALAEGRRLTAMSVRTAMAQFGYLLGAALGGVVLPRWGFAGIGVAYAALFAVAGVALLPSVAAGRAAPVRPYLRRTR